MSQKETPEERARSQAYADGVLAERRHTRRALDERDVQRARAETAERALVDARAQLAALRADKTVEDAYHQLREVAAGAYCALVVHDDPIVEREAKALGDVLYATRDTPTDEDRAVMAEAGGIAVRDLPAGAAEASMAIRLRERAIVRATIAGAQSPVYPIPPIDDENCDAIIESVSK